MRLSAHFTSEEMEVSEVAARKGIDNRMPSVIASRMMGTANLMEVVRAELHGSPIFVTSGYRCEALNTLVNGAAGSAHMTGDAVDFIAPGFGDPFLICMALEMSPIAFDQLIYEYTWVHISFAPAMRRELWTRDKEGFSKGIRHPIA